MYSRSESKEGEVFHKVQCHSRELVHVTTIKAGRARLIRVTNNYILPVPKPSRCSNGVAGIVMGVPKTPLLLLSTRLTGVSIGLEKEASVCLCFEIFTITGEAYKKVFTNVTL